MLLFIGRKSYRLLWSGLVCFCCFCLRILSDFNRIECRWANMKRALPDLIPKYETLEKLCTPILTTQTLKPFCYSSKFCDNVSV